MGNRYGLLLLQFYRMHISKSLDYGGPLRMWQYTKIVKKLFKM